MLIVTEGETDLEFYKKVLEKFKLKYNKSKFPFDNIDFVCAKGIGNLQSKIINVIKRRLFNTQDYVDAKKTIILCYDKDVFEYSQNPPIDREQLISEIKSLGECNIIRIEANRMIEDFFLHDYDGIRKYLRLKQTYKLKLTGYQGLKKMFKDAGKTYFKGEKAEGFIDRLDLDLIIDKIGEELKELKVVLSCE